MPAAGQVVASAGENDGGYTVSQPITVLKRKPVETELVEREYTYEELLELFPDGGESIVNPLVRRCQEYEEEIERLREEITDGDYWHKRATQALEVGTCPLCFSVDESGHEANCPWGDAEDRAERFGAELDRLREWVAAVEDGYDKQQAEIKRLKAEREDQMELGRELRRRLNREIE